jgi:hypothetical protein
MKNFIIMKRKVTISSVYLKSNIICSESKSSSEDAGKLQERGETMSPRTLQMGGWILLGAAVLSIVGTALQFVIPGPLGLDGPPSNVVSVMNIVAGILFLVSLPVAYMKQSKQVGVVGLIGIIALWLTFLLIDVVLSILAIVLIASNAVPSSLDAFPPALFALFIAATVLAVIGGILFGIKTFQAHIFPALIGPLLIVGAILTGVSFPLEGNISTIVNTLGNVLLFAGLGWLGYTIATQAETGTMPSGSSVPRAS